MREGTSERKDPPLFLDSTGTGHRRINPVETGVTEITLPSTNVSTWFNDYVDVYNV
jgi:hypothetical protein